MSRIIDVIVPCWNAAGRIADCVEALLASDQAGIDLRILICDDGSADSTPQVAQELAADPRVRYLRGEHGGVNATRNLGLRAARRDAFVAFVDDDELVPVYYFQTALKLLDERPECGGVGGPYRTLPGKVRPRVCRQCRPGDASVPVRADGTASCLLGGNAVIRPATFATVGEFDMRLSGFGDESEWYDRAARLGIRFVYSEDLVIAHRRDNSTLWELSRKAISQGSSLPAYWRITGDERGPRYGRVLRALAHALLLGCSHAWRDALTQGAAAVEWWRAAAKRTTSSRGSTPPR